MGKKLHLIKIKTLQKKLGNDKDSDNVMDIEMDDTLKQQLSEMSASKEEMANIISKILNTIRNISQLSVLEDHPNIALNVKVNQCKKSINVNNVEQHLIVLNTIQNIIHDQNNMVIKLKRDIDGLQSDIKIREEKIKLLQDQMILSPNCRKKSLSRRSNKKNRKKSLNMNNDHRSQ